MRMKRSRFFGMERARSGGQYFATVASAEKAILDSLAYPMHCPVAEAAAAISTGVDGKLLRIDVLAEMALRLGSRSAAKRLGYIAESSGEDLFETLGPLVSARYDLLDSGLPSKGARNRRWRLIINEAI
jgi:predicted transcriptional regulator of viral defense system